MTAVTTDAPQDGPIIGSAANSAIVDSARLLHTLDSAGAVLLNKSVGPEDSMLVSFDKIKAFASEQLLDKESLDSLRKVARERMLNRYFTLSPIN